MQCLVTPALLWHSSAYLLLFSKLLYCCCCCCIYVKSTGFLWGWNLRCTLSEGKLSEPTNNEHQIWFISFHDEISRQREVKPCKTLYTSRNTFNKWIWRFSRPLPATEEAKCARYILFLLIKRCHLENKSHEKEKEKREYSPGDDDTIISTINTILLL